MKSNKILCLLLSLMLVFGIVLSFTGCTKPAETECTEHKDANGDGVCDTEGCDEPVAPTPSAGTFNENGELFLFKDSTPTFKFVYGEDAATFMPMLEELATAIQKSTKDKAIPAVVGENSEVSEIEILVGTVTNRGDMYKINKYDYGNTGYAVKQVGTKLVVIGGSDDALEKAISHLKNTVFGIKKNTPAFGDFVMTEKKTYEVKQSNYTLKDITVDGDTLKNYVLTYQSGDNVARNIATALQTTLYNTCGIRPEVMLESNAGGMKKISFRTLMNDGEGNGLYVNVDKDKNLIFECEYSGKFSDIVNDYFNENVFSKRGVYNFAADFNYSPDLRNITYEQFGAKGDGTTDDFFAIKAAHDEANEYMLNVHANPNATYHIGHANGNKSITIQTNTYWHGCKFIFNDEGIEYSNSSARETSIFRITPSSSGKSYGSNSSSPVKSLESGATNLGWAPGMKVLVQIQQNDIRHHIRSGGNASQSSNPMDWGKPQQEVLIVDENGNIDPSTPVQWTYTKITKLTTYVIGDKPIEIVGEGDNGRKTLITTWYNNGPSAYWYYERNIMITRSNVKISGVQHTFDKYVLAVDGGEGSPYNGFLRVMNACNINIDNFTFLSPPGYKDVEPDRRPSSYPAVTNSSLGSYETTAESSVNVTWSNCDQTDFFRDNGDTKTNGNMGTNFCRNLVFDNVTNCTFDAHCGLYNATMKDSTLYQANFIGAGLIRYENVVIYAERKIAIKLRDDYGSIWNGDVEIDGLIMKTKESSGAPTLSIVNATWTNWNYGYTTYLPQNFTIRNLVTAEYTHKMVDNGSGNMVREETITSYNVHKVTLFNKLNSPTVNYTTASHVGSEVNLNKMVATKKLELYTTYTGKYASLGITKELTFYAPSGPFFSSFEYYKDGVLQN